MVRCNVPSIHGKVVYGARAPRHCSSQQCGLSVSEVWSEKFFVPAARRCSPMPLCDALDCVHLLIEGLHRGILSLRGPLVSSDIAGHIDPRVSFCRLVLAEKSLSLSHATSLHVF